MSNEELRLLMEIKGELVEIKLGIKGMQEDLKTDRSWVWRILALTIVGAFALIGVKLAFP